MNYKYLYKTPNNFDDILLEADEKYLTRLSFINSNIKYNYPKDKFPIFEEVIKWLDIYFCGKSPNFTPNFKINNLTPFRENVFKIVSKIPFGSTITYGDIAKIIAKEKGISKMSSEAVGNALKANPICIIIPCHRVLGKNNTLTGYNGGINNKIALLQNENIKFKI